MAALIRAVGKNAALQHIRLQPAGQQHNCAGDEAIDQNHAPLVRCLQHGTQHGCHFKAAESRQHIERGQCICVLLQYPGKNRRLAHDRRRIQAGTGTGALTDLQPGEPGHHQGRCGCIADTHFSQQQYIAG